MTNFDPEEQELLKSFEDNEWLSEKTPDRLQLLQSYLETTLAQNEQIILDISRLDLEYFQTKANEEGITYQTLITNILHKYITGELIEKTF